MAYQRPLLKGLQGRFYMTVKTFKTFRMLFKCVLKGSREEGRGALGLLHRGSGYKSFCNSEWSSELHNNLYHLPMCGLSAPIKGF